MKIRLVVAASVMVFSLSACGSRDDAAESDGAWVGTSTSEGNVTTVVNEAGSVWGGTATLVEEMSIGGLDGGDASVFSGVRAVAASDERIFVLDGLATIVRVYDMVGAHLFDIGGEGDGPGEFRRPWAIGLSREPRLLVRDLGHFRIHAFSLAGELLDDWPAAGGAPTTVADEGFAYVYTRVPAETGEAPLRWAMVAVGPDAPERTIPLPEFEHQRPLLPVAPQMVELSMMQARNLGLPFSVADVPFAPNPQWALASDGTMIWGESDTYRFSVERLDGTVTQVERTEDPVTITVDEGRWYRDRLTRFWRDLAPEFVWPDEETPRTKPAFSTLIPDRDGRVWVLRELAGVPLADCDPDPDDFSDFLEHPCWHQPYALDGFGADGRYLGRISMADGTRVDVSPFIAGDSVITVVEDEAGAIMVKRYRLVLPGEQ
jgi:hypothetical protein